MNKYIATFFSHYGALTYYKEIKKQNIRAKLMPVPRSISTSCGTCVFFENTFLIDSNDELESIYQEVDGKLTKLLNT